VKKIGQPLERLLKRLGVAETMHGWRAVELWPEVAGERVADHARAVGFRDGVLVVEVDNPAWMNELTYLQRRFAAELNKRLGEDIVREVRLRPARTSSTPVRGQASPDATPPFRKP